MSTLTGKTPAQTYKDLLQVSNGNAGIDSTLREVSDGEATSSPLQLSVTKVQAKGSGAVFEVANSSGAVLFEIDTTLNTITAKSGVSFEGDGSGLTGVLSTGVGGASATVDLEMLADSDNNGSGDLIFKIGTKEVGRIPNTYAAGLPVGVAGQYFLLPTGWASPNVGVEYNGSTQYSSAADDPNLNFGTGDFSVEWYGEYDNTNIDNELISKGNASGIIEIRASSSVPKGINFKISDGTNSNRATYTRTVGKYKDHIVGVRNSNTIYLYVDKTLVATADVTSVGSVSSTAEDILLGQIANIYHQKGNTYKAKLYNYALSQSEVDARWDNGDPMGFVEPFETRKAKQTALTSGSLVIGKKYIIDTYVSGDDFTNVGGTNISGNVFVATGTTPTTWTNSSSLRLQGNIADWDYTNGGVFGVVDGSGNGNHLQHVNSPIVLNNEISEDVKITITGATTLTNLVPKGSKVESIYFDNTTANAVTGGIKIGTTAGGIDVVTAGAVGANAEGLFTLAADFFSSSADQTLYVDAVTAWNSASVDLIFKMGKVI